MASANPPTAPAAIAQKMLILSGNGPPCPRAISDISANAHACENAVRTNALARREPYPPAKSDAPQMKTAATEYAAGGKWTDEITPDEGTTEKQLHRRRVSLGQPRASIRSLFRGEAPAPHRLRVLKFPQAFSRDTSGSEARV